MAFVPGFYLFVSNYHNIGPYDKLLITTMLIASYLPDNAN